MEIQAWALFDIGLGCVYINKQSKNVKITQNCSGYLNATHSVLEIDCLHYWPHYVRNCAVYVLLLLLGHI